MPKSLPWWAVLAMIAAVAGGIVGTALPGDPTPPAAGQQRVQAPQKPAPEALLGHCIAARALSLQRCHDYCSNNVSQLGPIGTVNCLDRCWERIMWPCYEALIERQVKDLPPHQAKEMREFLLREYKKNPP